jgi:hypothetical protein
MEKLPIEKAESHPGREGLVVNHPDPNCIVVQRFACSNLSSVQAEKLIRELNMFPKNDLNIIDNRYSLPPPKNKIVKKQFVLPKFVGSGAFVEDLGHHDGYYNIEHSHATRSVLKP